MRFLLLASALVHKTYLCDGVVALQAISQGLPPSTPKLFELASTCVHGFDEDKAEEENQSQHTITTFEAIERSIE